MPTETTATKTEATIPATPKAKAKAPKIAKAEADARIAAAAKAVKPTKAAKAVKADKDDDEGPSDRLPTTIDELKAAKGGLVAYLYLNGKDNVAITSELQAKFKVTEVQAAKITRRITGRVRLFQRIFALVPAKA